MLQQQQHLFKGCLLCNEIFIELASLHIQTHKKGYPQIANKVVSLLYPVWTRVCQSSLEKLQGLAANTCSKDELMTSLTLLKLSNSSLQKIIVSNPEIEGDTVKVIENMQDLLRIYGLEIYNQIPDDNMGLEIVKSKIGEILIDARTCILETHKKYPYQFRPFLRRYLAFARQIINNPSNPRLLLTFAFSFLKNVYMCRAYDPNRRGGHLKQNRKGKKKKTKKDRPSYHHGLPLGIKPDQQACQEANVICMQFFTDDNIIQICEIIVTKYFVLTEYDMQKWNNDPEEFFQESLLESSNEAVRQVCASFFKHFMKKRKKVLAPHIVSLFIQTLKKDVSNHQCAIEREALYHAVGLGYFDLHDALKNVQFTFSEFYQQFLHRDCNPECHTYLVRRATWLLGEVKDDLLRERNLATHVFEILMAVMTRHNDTVVKLTCVHSLNKLIMDSEFETSTFLPQAPHFCEALVSILNTLGNVTNVGFVVTCLTNILDKMGNEMGERSGSLLQLVQQLWENFPHDLVRASVVGVLTSVVKALKAASTEYHEFLVPVLEYVTDFTQSDRLYLNEQGLELWLAVAQNSCRMTPQLLKLFERWIYCMRNCPDNLQQCLDLFKSYLLLGGADFVAQYQEPLQDVLAQTIQALDSYGTLSLCNVLCMFIQMFPDQSPVFLQPILEKCFISMVELTHPFTIKQMKPYLMICGRLFFHNFQGGVSLIMNLEQRESRQILDDLLKRYMAYMEKLRLSRDLKLCTLAFCNFAYTDLDQSLLARMVPILMKCAIETGNNPDLGIDTTINGPMTESERLLLLVANDASVKADVVKCVRAALDNILNVMGGHKFGKQLKKIPNKTLNRWEHVQKRRNN